MHSPGLGYVLGTLITQLQHVEAVEQIFPSAKKDRADRNVHFVNESGFEVLPNRTDATTEPNILPVRCVFCEFQRGIYSLDEVEGCATIHRNRWSWVIREHEDSRVIRRIVAPPALPSIIRPRSADRSEHVAAHDPCSKVGKTPRHKIVINTAFANVIPFQMLKGASVNDPVVESQTADAEGIVDVLLGPAP